VSKQSLLLVDSDTRSMRVLEVSLRKAGFSVTTATSVQDALDKLELDAPDLIISETTFADGDGFELRRRVRVRPEWGEIPFIFLTAEAAIENKIKGLELGVDDYLTKPIYIKEIVTRINILLQKRQRVRFEERRDGRTRFAGRVADMPVVDVIQTIEISRKSGVIQFVGERNRQAAIYFRDGRVIDAEAGALQGEDAVYRLLTWSEGDFEVVFRTVRRREVINTSSQGLLMEGMRRLDEWSRLLEQLPPLFHRFEVDAAELASRLGDVPDDNNPILRLIDGKRTLLEVIDASDVGDLECLQAISRLYFEEMLIDVDHGAPSRPITGKHAAPLVEVDVPFPIEDVPSGPLSAPISGPLSVPVSGPLSVPVTAPMSAPIAARVEQLAAPEAIDSNPDIIEERRDSSRDLAARAVTKDEDELPAKPNGQHAPALVEAKPNGEHRSSDPAIRRDSAEEIEAADIEEATDAEPADRDSAEEIDPDLIEEIEEPGELHGSYRQSSLMLIDAAVAAATAIEPQLFEDKPPPDTGDKGDDTIDPSLAALAREADAIPRLTDDANDDMPEIASGSVQLVIPSAIEPEPSERMEARPVGREDSGLRMIGSLGRDRAEASGELALPLAPPVPARATTERELVTILPRRITREMAAVVAPPDTPEAAADKAEPAPPAAPVEPPARRPPPPKVALTGSGVVRQSTGPGRGAVALLALAGILAVVAIYLYATRPSKSKRAPDAGISGPVITPIGDATELAPDAESDDAQLVVVVDAAVAIDAAPKAVDAAVVAIDAAAKDDPIAKAKELYDQAFTALEEGRFDKALELVEQSLKLRKTARSFLLRAQALQRLGRVDEALVSLQAGEQTFPSPAIYEARARILKAAGRNAEARDAIMKYLELVPDRGPTVKLFKQWLEELR
jgi:CheY-like chemotaxis protein